jgi:hypothetical protein
LIVTIAYFLKKKIKSQSALRLLRYGDKVRITSFKCMILQTGELEMFNNQELMAMVGRQLASSHRKQLSNI